MQPELKTQCEEGAAQFHNPKTFMVNSQIQAGCSRTSQRWVKNTEGGLLSNVEGDGPADVLINNKKGQTFKCKVSFSQKKKKFKTLKRKGSVCLCYVFI